MKKQHTAPTPLDLDALDQIMGGCQVVTGAPAAPQLQSIATLAQPPMMLFSSASIAQRPVDQLDFMSGLGAQFGAAVAPGGHPMDLSPSAPMIEQTAAVAAGDDDGCECPCDDEDAAALEDEPEPEEEADCGAADDDDGDVQALAAEPEPDAPVFQCGMDTTAEPADPEALAPEVETPATGGGFHCGTLETEPATLAPVVKSYMAAVGSEIESVLDRVR